MRLKHENETRIIFLLFLCHGRHIGSRIDCIAVSSLRFFIIRVRIKKWCHSKDQKRKIATIIKINLRIFYHKEIRIFNEYWKQKTSKWNHKTDDTDELIISFIWLFLLQEKISQFLWNKMNKNRNWINLSVTLKLILLLQTTKIFVKYFNIKKFLLLYVLMTKREWDWKSGIKVKVSSRLLECKL